MKRLFNILLILFAFIGIVFGLAFAFLQARLLVSLDWIIYDNAFNGFIRYFFRLLIALFAITVCVLDIINIKRKQKTLAVKLYVANIMLFVMSIVIAVFATNYVGLACLSISGVLLIIKSLITFIKC